MTLDNLLTAAVAAILDPIALFVLLWPGLLHERWWPRVAWAIGWTCVTALLRAPSGYAAEMALATFAGSLLYMTMLWLARRAYLARPLKPTRP
ncbi:hypothetical protein [Brevundimonas sp.]|uniref:hypothetical protein n=1 Tax=Brevundimonas sp. TaxID=1871086 RepID=UPI002898DB34|nr:hypothetical protein [Brevundimonas sp.]